ncbi:SbmA/BacA-like family transporter [Bradyrhizobium roseum]|uniref:SbmA/BacA-like family transporter n=1 Tax=Bradyrhizobium roseum TaxID=3056648 RepID=UPI002610BC24|nr:SbmA/BacA-like family transporter [Bradyrhizobium roseus]WKA29715.1 SbmA/BacA-like family transporter [Bradyrhizobium roseus]
MLQKKYFAPDEIRLLARFWQSASGFWRGGSASMAWLLVGLLVATVLLQLFTQYRLNFWNRDFFDAIERKNAAGLWQQALALLPIATASLALAIISVWGRMTMQRKWREWLSNHLYDYWLERDHIVRLRFMSGEHQAPEFRIAEDARVATDLPIDLLLGLLSSILVAITFISVLWNVGGGLVINAFGTSLVVPGYLVIAVSAYSVLLTAAMMLIARHLTRVIEENKRTEAELRSVGTHLREAGERLVEPEVYRNGRRAIGAALEAVIRVWRIYCWQLMRMTMVTHTNVLLTPLIGLLLCTPKYIEGTMTLGEVIQAAAAFVVVQSAFNWVTDSYGRIAEWAASANRVASLLLALDQIHGQGDLKS